LGAIGLTRFAGMAAYMAAVRMAAARIAAVAANTAAVADSAAGVAGHKPE